MVLNCYSVNGETKVSNFLRDAKPLLNREFSLIFSGMSSCNYALLLVEEQKKGLDRTITGVILGSFSSTNHLLINLVVDVDCFVFKIRRRQRRGTSLLKVLKAICKKNECKNILLWTSDMKTLANFWKSNDFQIQNSWDQVPQEISDQYEWSTAHLVHVL